MSLNKYVCIILILFATKLTCGQESNLKTKGTSKANEISNASVGLKQTSSKAAFLSGSWGVRFNLNGGIRLDNTSNFDWVQGAQEIVDNLTNVGHVITNFTHPAHGYYYTLRSNPYVDIANEIHPAMVPTLANEQIILDVINVFKNAGKKVILYINAGGPSSLQGNSAEELEILAAWENYCDLNFGGDQGLGWRTLAKGYFERFKDLGVDGYWIDNLSSLPGEVNDFVSMIRDVDPDAALATNLDKSYLKDENGNDILVDSDGVNDEDSTDYKVFFLEANDPHMDFTAGHPTPLGQGAPPNSWAYEELSFPLITENPWSSFDGSKQTLKHYFIPIRERWSVASADLVFELEQAYRFVRLFTDAAATMTWSTTITNGYISSDEMSIMQEVNNRMVQTPKPAFVPYVRPEGAYLVGETLSVNIDSPEFTFPNSVNGSKVLGLFDESEVTYQPSAMNPNTTNPVATPNTSTIVSSILPNTKNSKMVLSLPTPVFPGANFSFSIKMYSDNSGSNGTGSGRIVMRLYNSTLGFGTDDRIEIINANKIGGEWQTVSFLSDSLYETNNANIMCAGGYDRILILASNGANTLEKLYFDDLQGAITNPGDGTVGISDTPTLASENSWIYDNGTANLNYVASSFGNGSGIEETVMAPVSGLANNASTSVLKFTRSLTAASSGVRFKGTDFNYLHTKNITFRVFPECDTDSEPTLELRLRKSGENSGDTQLNSGTITMIPNQWNEITLDMSEKTPSLAPALNNLYDTVLLLFNRTEQATTGGNFYYVDALQLKTGATNTWTGATDSTWATASNWSLGTIPLTSENVIVPSGLTNYPTINTAVSINNISLIDDASLVFSGGSLTIANNTTYTRTVAGSKWYLIASPVVGETYEDNWVTENGIASGLINNKGISFYNNSSNDAKTGHWRYFQSGGASTPFKPAQGYGIIRSSTGTVSFIGSDFYLTSQNTTIAPNTNNYSLVSNPFTAYLNLGSFFTSNATTSLLATNTIWIWNANSGIYEAKLSGLDSAYEIAHGQAFFVEAGSVGGTLNFDINDVTHQNIDTFQKTSNSKTVINLSITDENKTTRKAKIYFIDGATKGFDNGFDGELFAGTSHSLALFTELLDTNSKKYQVQSLPISLIKSSVIPLGLIAPGGKNITLNTSINNLPLNTFVYLEDKSTGSFTLLNNTTSLNFTTDKSLDGKGRFYIHTYVKTLSIENEVLDHISIFKTNNNILKINGLQYDDATISIFNILGKQVMQNSFLTSETKEIILPNLSTGVYIVKLNSHKNTLIKKILIE